MGLSSALWRLVHLLHTLAHLGRDGDGVGGLLHSLALQGRAGEHSVGGDSIIGHHLDKARLVEKGFLLVVALAHPGRAGGEDQVLLGGLVAHAVHGEAGELLGAGLILLWGFSLVQLPLLQQTSGQLLQAYWCSWASGALFAFLLRLQIMSRTHGWAASSSVFLEHGGWAVMTVRTLLSGTLQEVNWGKHFSHCGSNMAV